MFQTNDLWNTEWAPRASAACRSPSGWPPSRSGSNWVVSSLLDFYIDHRFTFQITKKYNIVLSWVKINSRRNILGSHRKWDSYNDHINTNPNHLEMSRMQFMMTAHIFLDSTLSNLDILMIIVKSLLFRMFCVLIWTWDLIAGSDSGVTLQLSHIDGVTQFR